MLMMIKTHFSTVEEGFYVDRIDSVKIPELGGQFYEDKSLALRARDLIFLTTDLQTVNYYSKIPC